MRLFILLYYCLHGFITGICWASNFYCVHQPKTFLVKESDSVTIPCSYTYPENFRGKSQITISLGEAYSVYCSTLKKLIIDQSVIIDDAYKDRITVVNHPDNQTSSIVIQGLKASDGVVFCCRVIVVEARYEFYDYYGTFLNLADGQWLSQVEELIAVEGEELIIPCHNPLKTQEEPKQVAWYTGEDQLCNLNSRKIYTWSPGSTGNTDRFSLVNISEDFSLRIHHVQSSQFSHFCCLITNSNGKDIKSRISTELTIADPSSSSPFSVTQPNNITGHRGESVTLSCLYSQRMESDALGVNIYWRVGNISGPYAYHPYKEMVHPGYRGRTEIQGEADLHIRGLQMSDGSEYYCFVVIRLCTGNSKYQKRIQYGEGTRLMVTEPLNVPGGYQLVIMISIAGAVLLVLLCVILLILKITGFICKKKNVSETMKTSENPENAEFDLEERPYCGVSTKNIKHNQKAEEATENEMEGDNDEPESEKVLYSELNKTKLQQRNPATYQKMEEETVYAAIVSPDSRK